MKAVFMDYTGTITLEDAPVVRKILKRCYENSTIGSPQEMLAYWWKLLRKYEMESYLDNYKTEDEIVDLALADCKRELALNENLDEIHSMFQEFWTKSPVFDDVADFFAKCPLPIYIVTNNGVEYVQVVMNDHHLNPAGIICGDMVKAYKPHKEIFLKALDVSGCRAEEAIHIGDSVSSDVLGAQSAGIKAVLLDRTGKGNNPEYTTISSLNDLFQMGIF